MTLVVTNRTRVVDQSSAYRGKSGTVMAIAGSYYDVRLDGFGSNQVASFLINQLGAEPRAAAFDYSH